MEIIFNEPIWFLLLLSIPVMIVLHFYFFEHNKRRAMKFANFSVMKRVTGTHLITKNHKQLIMRIIILLILTLSATQPVVWYVGEISLADYVLAIDASASMVATDVPPSRIEKAKESARRFVDKLTAETKVGVISFSGVSFIKSPLTTDKLEVKRAINDISIELAGGTDIGAALITANNVLAQGNGSKVVILITDGSDTAGSFVEESIETAAHYVRLNHLKVHTIGIGTEVGKAGYLEEQELGVKYDEHSLKYLAETTGGKYFKAEKGNELDFILQEIITGSKLGKIPYDLSSKLLGVTILLVLIEWGVLNTKFRPLP